MLKPFPTVWLIQRGREDRPLPQFLHDLAPSCFGWSTDRSRARRFKTRGAAEETADDILAGQFHASEHSLRDLIRAAADGTSPENSEDLVGF